MHILFKEYFLGIMNACFIFKLLILLILFPFPVMHLLQSWKLKRFVLGVHYLVYLYQHFLL